MCHRLVKWKAEMLAAFAVELDDFLSRVGVILH